MGNFAKNLNLGNRFRAPPAFLGNKSLKQIPIFYYQTKNYQRWPMAKKKGI